MSVIKLSPDNYVVFAAIPYNEPMISSLTELIQDQDWLKKVSHVIIPDNQHTMGVLSYQKYLKPDVKIVGMDLANPEINSVINVRITNSLLDRVISNEDLQKVGISDPLFLSNLKMVFMPSHANKELMVYDTVSKTFFAADLFFNVSKNNSLEDPHFCEQFDHKPQFSGASFIMRYLNPHSAIGRGLFAKVVGGALATPLLRLISSLGFQRIVLCHGDIIEKNAAEDFKTAFQTLL